MVRSFNTPKWIGPLLLLAALALIPFALLLALSFAALAAGFFMVRTLILPHRSQKLRGRPAPDIPQRSLNVSSQILEAEFEVKDAHEKD